MENLPSFFLLLCFPIALCSPNLTLTGCIAGEREALLRFKAGLKDPSGRLSSWAGIDCCSWRGVRCSRMTGHVFRLDLQNTEIEFRTVIVNDREFRMGIAVSNSSLEGEINQSLLSLKHLNYLDLSMNDFGGIPIPAFIGSMNGLRYLNLSHSFFGLEVPHQIGNLSRLQYLDLSQRWGYGCININNDQWLSYLTSLKHLNLNGLRVRNASTFFQSLNMNPSLVELHLAGCSLDSLHSVLHFNSTSLRILDLSANSINSRIPLWLFELKNIEYLELGDNRFSELMPDAIGNLTSLKLLGLSSYPPLSQIRIPTTLRNLCFLNELILSWNNYPHNFQDLRESFSGCISDSLRILVWHSSKLKGRLPEWLGMLKNSYRIDLFDNDLNGALPKSLCQLQELVRLDLWNNKLKGELVEAHFASLTRLEYLDVSDNNLSLHVAPDWSPPPLLTYVGLRSCRFLDSQFPVWLRKLKIIREVHMRSTGISGVIPDWFWNFSSALEFIDLSYNEIKGQLPISLEHLNLTALYLGKNQLDGPQFSSRLNDLGLSMNSFSGSISPEFWKKASGLKYLYLSANNLSGTIHHSVCELKFLQNFDLSRNHFSGDIPDCWNLSSSLVYLNLGNNNLSGSIPNSFHSIPSLETLQVSNNGLSGELPLQTCTSLQILDIGYNKFSGTIPTWIGENLNHLQILRLRSNMFTGTIPDELGNLAQLRVMDLAHNNLSGVIPHSFGNLTALRYVEMFSNRWGSIMLHFRGREDEYLYYPPTSIDLAANNLNGVIPEEIATLYGLQNLDLSENHLTGRIPNKIGDLRQLESLDLSFNHLSGPIPAGMTALSFLDHLNLSFNDLSGQIPSGGQLQVLPDPSIFAGNHDLCGYPLSAKCHAGDNHDGGGGASQTDSNGEDQNSKSKVGTGPGFMVGVCVVCVPLLLNNKWRIAYFSVVDNLIEGIHVALARMKRQCFSFFFFLMQTVRVNLPVFH